MLSPHFIDSSLKVTLLIRGGSEPVPRESTFSFHTLGQLPPYQGWAPSTGRGPSSTGTLTRLLSPDPGLNREEQPASPPLILRLSQAHTEATPTHSFCERLQGRRRGWRGEGGEKLGKGRQGVQSRRGGLEWGVGEGGGRYRSNAEGGRACE